MGINNGSHNGNGVITEAFEALCQQGIPVVLSVGNEGDTRTTLHKTFESDDDVLRGMIGSSFSLLEGYTFADVPLTMQLSLVRQDMDYYLDGSEGGFTTLWQSLVLERLSTGISQIPDAADAVRHSIFMMDGRRVIGTPTHGLYVVDGKKVVVK